MKKKVLSALLTATLLFSIGMPAFATPNEEVIENQAKYDELTAKIDEITGQVYALDAEIEPLMETIENNKAEVEEIKIEVENTEKEIETTKADIEKREAGAFCQPRLLFFDLIIVLILFLFNILFSIFNSVEYLHELLACYRLLLYQILCDGIQRIHVL